MWLKKNHSYKINGIIFNVINVTDTNLYYLVGVNLQFRILFKPKQIDKNNIYFEVFNGLNIVEPNII